MGPAWDTGFVSRQGRAAAGPVGKFLGRHITGGSTTVADMSDRLRAAGVSARETLKQAAADCFVLPRVDLMTEGGAVILPNGDRMPYVDLATDAAMLDPVNAIRPSGPGWASHCSAPSWWRNRQARSVMAAIWCCWT